MEKFARHEHETQESISTWADSTFGLSTSNTRAAIRANEEMAELLKHLAQLESLEVSNEDELNWVMSMKAKVAAEIADVFIVLYRVASNLGVNVHKCVDEKMAINRNRKWKRDGTGHGYHVKE